MTFKATPGRSGDRSGPFRGAVAQDPTGAERRRLLPGVGATGQLNVEFAGDQLGLCQFQHEGQLRLHDISLLRLSAGTAAAPTGWPDNPVPPVMTAPRVRHDE